MKFYPGGDIRNKFKDKRFSEIEAI